MPSRSRRTALVAVGFGIVPGDAAPVRTAATWTAPTWDPPQVTAHRGGSDERPENTMEAFRNAVAVGADTVEFDVRSTKDHRLVVLHDRTLDRTTNCTGAVYTGPSHRCAPAGPTAMGSACRRSQRC